MMPSEVAEYLCFAEAGDTDEEWTKVASLEGDDHRWWREMTEVFTAPDGALWAYDWKSGLTENQENEFPWEAGYNQEAPTEIEMYSVKPVVKTVTEYVAA